MAARTVLVTGATGKQGGSVINALLKANANFEILALTRNPQSASAQSLVRKSNKVKLVAGNLDAIEDVFKTAGGVSESPIWGVFSVQNPEKEERQGKALIDIALKNNVKTFVYSSVDRGGANSDHSPTDIPHFVSKHKIKQYLFTRTKGSNMTYTVLRPVAFFENLIPEFIGKVFSTSFQMVLRKDQKLQLIATSDIGFFGAEALLKPEKYANKKLSLAGDELTFTKFKSIFHQQTGQSLPMTFSLIAGLLNKMVKELGNMFRWFRDVGYGADIRNLKTIHPGLKGFKTWLATESAWKN